MSPVELGAAALQGHKLVQQVTAAPMLGQRHQHLVATSLCDGGTLPHPPDLRVLSATCSCTPACT